VIQLEKNRKNCEKLAPMWYNKRPVLQACEKIISGKEKKQQTEAERYQDCALAARERIISRRRNLLELLIRSERTRAQQSPAKNKRVQSYAQKTWGVKVKEGNGAA